MTARATSPPRSRRAVRGLAASRTPPVARPSSWSASLVTLLLPFIVAAPAVQRLQHPEGLWSAASPTAGVFVLLALGLNVVVGFAGLLDLGYAAFFAIGAYTYAYGASGFTGLDIPFWPMLLVGRRWWRRSSASCSARRPCGCAATTSRS